MTKSAIRHILTAVGTVLTLFGLDNFVDIFEFANQNLDGIWAAVETIAGAAITIYGFTKNGGRHAIEDAK